MRDHIQFDRRRFLQAAGLLAAGAATAACGGGGGDSGSSPPATPPASAAPPGTFTEPRSALSGALSILMWSHFVPAHDTWFDPWVKEWGSRVGVDVTVDHINYAELPARTQAEIQAHQGHDLILHIAPVPQYEPSVLDLTDVVTEASNRHGAQLELCRRSSYNPTTQKFFAYSPAWVPDPGDYRRSLWTPAGLGRRPADVGRPAARRRRDQAQPGRPARRRDVAGDRLEHGRAGPAVVVRRVHPGRDRAGGHQLAADRRGRRVHDPALPTTR